MLCAEKLDVFTEEDMEATRCMMARLQLHPKDLYQEDATSWVLSIVDKYSGTAISLAAQVLRPVMSVTPAQFRQACNEWDSGMSTHFTFKAHIKSQYPSMTLEQFEALIREMDQ